jgi:hypothetical protein
MLITCWFLTQTISAEAFIRNHNLDNHNLDNFVLEDSFNSYNPMVAKTGQIFSFLCSSF